MNHGNKSYLNHSRTQGLGGTAQIRTHLSISLYFSILGLFLICVWGGKERSCGFFSLLLDDVGSPKNQIHIFYIFQ